MGHHLPSCDTLAVAGACSATGQIIFAKNSDRDSTESQPLLYFPAADHAAGEKVKCTYIEVDQVPHTYAMIGSKPWWIWGFEHGINEWGVCIGNEADWSWVSPPDEDKLLGMDLLRLTLERSKTADEAVGVLTELLEKYGQGGGCQYGRPRMEFTYHNSYMITDPEEVWLVETVDRQWVAKKIDDMCCISNVYTIEDDYDEISEGMIDFAIEKGLHRAGETFNFSKSFMLLDGTNLTGHQRYEMMRKLMRGTEGTFSRDTALKIMRNHFEGEIDECRWSPASVMACTVCMHGTGEIDTCQTAATMIVEYTGRPEKELMFTAWCSMCPPCSSFLVPFFNTGYVPSKLGSGTNEYSEDSFWWKVMRMVTDIESNYERYHHLVTDVRPALEAEFTAAAARALDEAAALMAENKAGEACRLLNDLTDACLDRVEREVGRITAEIEEDQKTVLPQIYHARYIDYYRNRTKLPNR